MIHEVLCQLILFIAFSLDRSTMQQLELRPGTLYHKLWTEPPQPIYMDIYFFNWTNPLDYKNHSVKPQFDEIGPYRFQEIPQKVNVTWHDGNATVSYRKQSRYFFVPEQSKGRLDDVITSVNVIALVRTFSLFLLSAMTYICISIPVISCASSEYEFIQIKGNRNRSRSLWTENPRDKKSESVALRGI